MREKLKTATWAIVLTSILWNTHMVTKFYPSGVGVDFRIYYHAARGDLSWATRQPGYETLSAGDKTKVGWLYQDSLASLWLPFAVLPEWYATVLWMMVMHGCYLVLAAIVMEREHGFIFVLATLRPISVMLISGNVSPLLLLMSCHPIGAILASCIKPQFACLVLLHTLRSYQSRGMEAAIRF